MKTFVLELFLFLIYILFWILGLALTMATFDVEGPDGVMAFLGLFYFTYWVLNYIGTETEIGQRHLNFRIEYFLAAMFIISGLISTIVYFTDGSEAYWNISDFWLFLHFIWVWFFVWFVCYFIFIAISDLGKYIYNLFTRPKKSDLYKSNILQENNALKIFEKLNKLEKYIKLLPKPSKSQIPENLYILRIDGKTTDPILLTDIPKYLVDSTNAFVWDNENLSWKHITLYDEIVSFCQIGAYDTSNWTTKNLDVDKFRNGDIIPEAKTDEDWKLAGIMGTPAWCFYDNDSENGKKYGKLYNWFAVNDARGVAPNGYHIPKDKDWTILESLFSETPANHLKSVKDWGDLGNGTDKIGFNALPSGYRLNDGLFTNINEIAFYWSASTNDVYTAWYRNIGSKYSNMGRYNSRKSLGGSIRCLRD
jgi:uncharacterized protein (TIGR02145 family)